MNYSALLVSLLPSKKISVFLATGIVFGSSFFSFVSSAEAVVCLNGNAGQSYSFTLQRQGTANNDTSMRITWGDGTPNSSTNPGDSPSASATFSHTYSAPGTYNMEGYFGAYSGGGYTCTGQGGSPCYSYGGGPTSGTLSGPHGSHSGSPAYACQAVISAAATPPAPTATLSAVPTSISSGSSSSLSWSSTNATSCTGSGFNTSGATSGSVSVSPAATTTYSVSCTGAGGTANASRTVTVSAALNGSCSVSPTSINTGGSATWTASPTGGSGSYTYSWSGTDSLTGSTQSVNKTYSTSGTKTASVIITSGAQSVTRACTNSLTVNTTSSPNLCTAPPSEFYMPGANLTTSCPNIGYDQQIDPQALYGRDWERWTNATAEQTNYGQCAVFKNANPYIMETLFKVSSCPTPLSANLTINGSDGPLSVSLGTALNLSWSSTGATSCTARGTGWGSGGAVATNGSNATTATVSDTYILQCTNGSTTTTDSVQVILSNSLKVCQNSCSSGIQRGNTSSTQGFTLARGATQNLVACFNPATSCSDGSGNVTGTASWGENTGSNIVSLSGSNPKTVSANNAGTEGISATYSGQTANMNITVTCLPTVNCSNAPGRENYCQNQNFNVDNGCGTTISCSGTKTCNFNWKEVAP